MHDQFETLNYLIDGNERQKHAYAILNDHQILEKLHAYQPLLTGTVPIGIDIETSDLDIICCYTDAKQFNDFVILSFSGYESFTTRNAVVNGNGVIVANFYIENWEIEIFGQSLPTKQQHAYLHMIAEYKLLQHYGESLRKKVIQLKQEGYKTEPAFGMALGLKGNPYEELLKLIIY